ncbi:hypothetical protein HK097_000394 [Rhizophlyctis rosea]|uniref:SGF29 C-terminal domain-containing protein n=1 Tax=Rhizophlyctis rosea TaxID=64517 RepID=A0AAD5WZI6_9FUNG|nr:hypothetical protein HK097_000394 [Rhizophlyctis rosea]
MNNSRKRTIPSSTSSQSLDPALLLPPSLTSATTSSLSDAAAANEETTLWSQICADLNALDTARRTAESKVSKCNGFNQKLEERGERVNNKVVLKLMEKYDGCVREASEEEKILEQLRERLQLLIALRTATETGLDTKRKKRGEKPKLGSPMVKRAKSDDAESTLLQKGDQVAVKPISSDWLLAIVLRYIDEKKKYEVEDAEDDEERPGTRKKYIFPAKMVIPIPKDVNRRPEFEAGHEVLAQYPASSCFYKATVVLPPSKNPHTAPGIAGMYIIKFEDDGDIERTVEPRMVLDMPRMTKLTKS